MFALNIQTRDLQNPFQLHFPTREATLDSMAALIYHIDNDTTAELLDGFGNFLRIRGGEVLAIYMVDIEGTSDAQVQHQLIAARKQAEFQQKPRLQVPPSSVKFF